MDFVDPKDAPGVGTRGAWRRHLPGSAFGNGNDLRFTEDMTSIEVVEVNPVIDEANRTADLAVELIMSGLGKTNLYETTRSGRVWRPQWGT